jgi:hypothetical protein
MMRTMLTTLLTVLAAMSAGCGNGVEGLPLDELRAHVASPKPLRYLTQTIGPGQSGEAVAGSGPVLWYPLAPPDEGRRLVLRFGQDDRLEHAEVVAQGPGGRSDVTAEVIFDRANWPPAQRAL